MMCHGFLQSEDEMAGTENTSPNVDSNTTNLSVKTKKEEEVMALDFTSSSVVCNFNRILSRLQFGIIVK